MNTETKIFSDTPVKLVLSNKHDGHMSFGHDSDENTTDDINRFLDQNLINRKHTAGIECTYGPEKTYDQIIDITDQNARPKTLQKDARLITDALVTKLTDTILLLPVADCYPLVIFDPNRRVLALAHLGWQATNANLTSKLVDHLAKKYHSRTQDLLCYFGPGISADDYVFEDITQKSAPGWQDFIKKSEDGYHLDLLGYNVNQLIKSGVIKEHIESSNRDTVNDEYLESNYMHKKLGLEDARRYMLATCIS